ncbi:AraC family transcriptional regulator [Actinomycetospora sp. C-140]
MTGAPRPELLAAHRSVRTRDVDEAQERLSTVFSPHVLDTPRSAGFCARANAVRLGGTRIVYLELGAPVTIRPDPLDYYAVNIALSGRAEVRQGARAVRVGDGVAGSVVHPGTAFEMRWNPDMRQLSVLVDRPRLDARARVTGTGSRLAPTLDARSPAVRSWLHLVRWVVADAESGALTANPLAAAQAEDLLIAGLLTAQAPADDAPTETRGRTARAVDLVHGHLDEPITVADMARAAGVGVRALQAAFRDEHGVPPGVYLRDARLDRVHAELSGRGGALPASVTEAAGRWGFTHVPRFAAQYRRRFGAPPSEVLRRTRGA